MRAEYHLVRVIKNRHFAYLVVCYILFLIIIYTSFSLGKWSFKSPTFKFGWKKNMNFL